MRTLFVLLLFVVLRVSGQPIRYTSANTHSHNDYEQPIPFWSAWQARFGSIEADIWLIDGCVIVGHDRKEAASEDAVRSAHARTILMN